MNNDFIKGIVTGAVVGAAMGMIFDPTRTSKDTNCLKKKASKMVRAAGHILENIADM